MARALLSDRPVLLLDEPTGQLDDATARAVLDAVLARAADRALLWVTHRGGELAMFPEVHRLPLDPLNPPDPVPRAAGWRAAAQSGPEGQWHAR